VVRAIIAVLLAVLSSGQIAHAQAISEPPRAEDGTKIVGLPVFTLDGARVATVLEAGEDEGEMVALAVIRDKRGRTTRLLIIPANLFVIKAGRLELLLTARQLRARLLSDMR
jgi:hypothetical protein